MGQISIQTMIEGCKAKDPKAQRALVDQFGRCLYAICIRYMGDRHSAQDVLQEVYIKVLDKFEMYDPEKGALYSWLSTITVRECLNEIKKNKNKNSYVDLEVISEEVFSQDLTAIEKMSSAELLEKIAELPEDYRMVFNLVAIEGYSHKEIAEMLNFKEVTSRSKFYRARKLLMESVIQFKLRQYG